MSSGTSVRKATRKAGTSGAPAPTVNKKQSRTQPIVDPNLIYFDRNTKFFLIFLLGFLAIGTVLKLHGSAIGIWNDVTSGQGANPGTLWGTPKFIRIDEWSFGTPMIVSQAKSQPSFPIVNSTFGPGEVPLIIDMPARHWSMFFRPQFWGFFALDLERAFAFYWDIKAVLLLGGVFLLLMLLTRNDFAISLFGSMWVFFSAFIQWWYSGNSMPPDMVGCLALIVVAVHYIVLSEIRWKIAAASVIFVVCCLNFALHFYPPLQVPLFYLGLAVLAGSLVPKTVKGPEVRRDFGYRAAWGVSAIIAVAVLLLIYYRDALTAINLMRNTSYPGARLLTGGDVTFAQLFSGFYGFVMTEGHFPQQWKNICEASSFVLLFPIPIVALLWRRFRHKPVSGIEWSLAAYLVLVSVWMTIGAPRIIALLTGFSRTHEGRPFVGLGPASIMLCCIFLSRSKTDFALSYRGKLLGASVLLISLLLFSWHFNSVTGGFATSAQVALVVSITAGAGYLLLVRKRALFMACILVPNIWAHALVNPVATGLSPLTSSRVYREVARIASEEPEAGWAVYGSHVTANLFKAAGAKVFNGTNYSPPLEKLRILDPSSSSMPIYNRFAHIMLVPAASAETKFSLIAPDLYSIAIDPKHSFWSKLGVKYITLTYPSNDPEFLEHTTPVASFREAGLWLYRRNE
jgi:hypothetical protein